MPPPLLEVKRESTDSYKASRSIPQPSRKMRHGSESVWGQSHMVALSGSKRNSGAGSTPKTSSMRMHLQVILAAVGAIALSKGLPQRFELALGVTTTT